MGGQGYKDSQSTRYRPDLYGSVALKSRKFFAESQSAAKLPDKPACIGVSLFSRN